MKDAIGELIQGAQGALPNWGRGRRLWSFKVAFAIWGVARFRMPRSGAKDWAKLICPVLGFSFLCL